MKRIIITILVTGLIVGSGVYSYLYNKKKQINQSQQVSSQQYKPTVKEELNKVAREIYQPIIEKNYNFDFDPTTVKVQSIKIEKHEGNEYECEIQYTLRPQKSDSYWYRLKVTVTVDDNNKPISYQATKSTLDHGEFDQRLLNWNDINSETDLGKLYECKN